jgi:hypothetical protein
VVQILAVQRPVLLHDERAVRAVAVSEYADHRRGVTTKPCNTFTGRKETFMIWVPSFTTASICLCNYL